jgi:hypothetical protein
MNNSGHSYLRASTGLDGGKKGEKRGKKEYACSLFFALWCCAVIHLYLLKRRSDGLLLLF